MSENIIEKSAWQKKFVETLVKEYGLSYDHAMIAMGLCCEEKLNAYMEGYNKGYNNGFENKLKIGELKRNEQKRKIKETLNNAKMNIESDYRLRAIGSIDHVINLLEE